MTRLVSKEFQAWRERMATMPTLPPDLPLDQRRAAINAGMAALPLAEGTHSTSLTAGAVPLTAVAPDDQHTDRTILYFHGGGYRMGSAAAWRSFGSHLAAACDARVLLVDYRLAPEHPFPAAVDDAITAYRWLLDQGTSPGRTVVAGDSAGGGLSAALLVAARDRGLPLPAGAVLLSPWADLTVTAGSYDANAAADSSFSKLSATDAAALYLQDGDPRDPLASPVFADWSGLPPVLIHVGSTEVLVDDAGRINDAAAIAGVPAELCIYPDMPHVWHLSYPEFPEAVEAVGEVAAFVRRVTR